MEDPSPPISMEEPGDSFVYTLLAARIGVSVPNVF
jgi:hypothetical protein